MVREYEKKRENGRGHPLNITNTLVFYCISHAKLILFAMEVGGLISMYFKDIILHNPYLSLSSIFQVRLKRSYSNILFSNYAWLSLENFIQDGENIIWPHNINGHMHNWGLLGLYW